MDYHLYSAPQKPSSGPRFKFNFQPKKFIQLGVLLLLVGSTGYATYKVVNSPAFRQSRASVEDVKLDEALITKAKEKGSLSVIMRMAVDDTPEASLDEGKKKERKDKIKKLQDDTEEAIKGPNTKKFRKFESFPLVTAEVDEIGLRKLKALKGTVDLVIEDELLAGSLYGTATEIHTPEAYNLGFDGTGTVIAIIDSGVERDHDFFERADGTSKVIAEACFSENDSCPNNVPEQTGTNAAAPCGWLNPVDAEQFNSSQCSHGTHVAGIAAGGTSPTISWGPSSSTLTGIAKGANIVAVNTGSKYTDDTKCRNGDGTVTKPCVRHTTGDMLRGLDWIYQNRDSTGVDVVNMSLGGNPQQNPCTNLLTADKPFMDAVNQLSAVNIPVVIATGNSSRVDAIGWPACVPGSIAVASYYPPAGSVSLFSNAAPFHNAFFMAPGEGTDTSASTNSVHSSTLNNRYIGDVGTSMATPHMTGAIAIMKQLSPNITVQQIIDKLKQGATTIHDQRSDAPSNADYPKLNIYQAIQNLANEFPNSAVNAAYSDTDSTTVQWTQTN